MQVRPRHWVMLAGLGCLVATVLFPPPDGMSVTAWRVAGLALVMALWWLGEVVPLAVTALLPLALAPLLGLDSITAVSARYGDPLIVMFLGGFLLAQGIARWGLHERLARGLIRVSGQSPAGGLAAVMGATAFLSLWISNTASAMVMMPIAAGIVRGRNDETATALMLGVAFAATIGGMGSLIGTPPNAIFAAFAAQALDLRIGFAEWAMVGLPVAVVLLIAAWGMLAWITPGLRRAQGLTLPERSTAPMGTGARRMAGLAVLVALGWITRPLVEQLLPGVRLSDAGIAMIGAVGLFIVPSGQGRALLIWDEAKVLRWDILILVGGGLALAGLMDGSGLVAWIGQQAAGLGAVPVAGLVLLLAAMIVLLGELASNTAMAAIFLPVAGAMAQAMGVDPMQVLLPVALAASVGFMLPVATPPNAIVFGHDAVDRAAMLKAGAPLDVIGVFVATGFGVILGPLVF